ncbi:MAG: Crp/Fnr family transcriptional regulator [Aureispira sp.]|nr:Crp/Fnr family transcriptional regulator [Aureispira sp.]
MNSLTILQQVCAHFVDIPTEVWEDFSTHWKEVSYKKGDYITRAGQIERYLYIVLEGVQRGYVLRDGEEVVLGFAFDHSPSGVPESFLTQQPTETYLQAMSDSKLLRIHYDDMQAMYSKYKCIERLGRLMTEQLVVGMLKRQLALVSYTAEERYRRLLRESPRTLQLIPQKHLASYLGMKPETFSRLRKSVKWDSL